MNSHRNKPAAPPAKQLPNEVLLPEAARLISEGHTVTLTVRGNSMNPFLRDRRDRIVLGALSDDRLRPGRAVLARETGGRILFHRIIARNADTLTLRGDGNLHGTEQTTVADVMGCLIAAIRHERRYAADGWVWRLYSACWMHLPCLGRRCLLALYRRLFLPRSNNR
ncbi:MAG: S24/S26 family peptidase [Prevotellaceae bacterium]|jgi:hypothetical protein|nr:S24/S26 family peptidase [Prevotellaceae bacterium]